MVKASNLIHMRERICADRSLRLQSHNRDKGGAGVYPKSGEKGFHVETRQPHGTDEYHTEGVVGIFVFLIQLPLFHFFPMRLDIQLPLLEGFYFVLLLADHHAHLGFLHPG